MRKKRKWERLLAAILTVALIFGSLPTSALAARSGLTIGYVSENKETDEQTETETSSGVEIEAETETDSEPETDTETETGSEPETDTETEAGLETVTEAESEEEAGIELVTEAGSELETGAETETESESETGIESETENMTEEIGSEFILEDQGISEAAVFETPTEDGKVVKLSAPAGAFEVPADQVTMTAEPLTEEQKAALEEQLAALAEEDGMKVTGYVAYDINLWVNGEIVQPLLPVQVTFENIAVAETVEDEEEVPEDMSQVETAGFQMDTATNEITDVNDTTVVDDATPEDATVAVEVKHFTIIGSFFTQVDPTNPNNYVVTLEQSGDGTQEDGETEEGEESSGEVVTFEINVESLKGIGEGELTLVPSVVDGEEENSEGGTTEGEAQGTPVEVNFQSNGKNLKKKIKNPEALGENESWTQTIQIPVSELEGVTNPVMNIGLFSGKSNISTLNLPIPKTAAEYNKPEMSGPNSDSGIGINSFPHHKSIDYLGDGGNDSGNYTELKGEDYYRLYLDITGASEPVDVLFVIDESGSMRSKREVFKDMEDTANGYRYEAVEKLLNSKNGEPGLLQAILEANPGNKVAVVGFTGRYKSDDADRDTKNGNPREYDFLQNPDARDVLNGWTSGWNNQEYTFDSTVTSGNGTDCDAGLYMASQMFSQVKDENKRIMIFLSDGAPTFYLTKYKENGGAEKVGRGGKAVTTDNADVLKCIEETKKTIDLFKTNNPGVTIYAVGVRNGQVKDKKDQDQDFKDVNYDETEILNYMVSGTGGYNFEATDAKKLRDKLWEILFPYGVQIEDTLSKYVEFVDDDEIDVVVTKNDSIKDIILYQNGSLTTEGESILVAPDPITRSGNQIKVSFREDKPLEAQCTYTLSFNVRLTQYAKDVYKESGYDATGDDKTDWGTNGTSSKKPGFYSNEKVSTTVSYTREAGSTREHEQYEMPVVQTHDQTKTSTDADAPKGIGDEITYTIRWNNPKSEVANVKVTDTLDKGVDYVSANPAPSSTAGKVLTWDLGERDPYAFGTIELTVRVNENAIVLNGENPDEPDEVKNKATVEVGHDYNVETNTIENPIPKKREITPGNKKGVSVGNEITYRVYWENTYDEPAKVIVTDTLDPGLDYVDGSATSSVGTEGTYDGSTRTITWNLGSQGANTSGYVEFKATVNGNALTIDRSEDETTGPKVFNKAKVTVKDKSAWTNEVENPVSKPEKEETHVTTPKEVGGVTNSLKDGGLVQVGDTIRYGIKWKNYHDVAATVVITDELADELNFIEVEDKEHGTYDAATRKITWNLGTQAAGASGEVFFKAKVNEKAEANWVVNNKAYVNVGGDGDVETNPVENPVPHKEETAPGDRESVAVNQEITYTIYWKNGYDVPAEVIITDPLDEGVDFVSASEPGTYNKKEHKVTWNLGTQEAGESGSVTLTVKVNKKALENDNKVENQAGVKIGNDPEVRTNKVENPVPEKREKTPGDDHLVNVGDTITYEIDWQNGYDEPRTVTITDKLDPNVAYVEGSAEATGGTYDKGTRTITWTINAKEKATGTVSFSVTVLESAAEYGEPDKYGKVTNSATVKVGDDPVVEVGPVENPVPKKEESTPGAGKGVKPDDQITYDIYWENSSDSAADVKITDVLDEGVEFVEDVTSAENKEGLGNYTFNNDSYRTLTWTFKAPANSKGKVSFVVEVLESAVDYATGGDGKVLNKATVQVGNSSVVTNEIENPTTEPHKMENAPGDKKGVQVGDEIMYTVTYENYKNEEATVTITDELDPGLDYVKDSATSTAGVAGIYDETTRIITWTIPDVPARGEANSTGFVTFRATVNEKALDKGETGKPDDDSIFVPGDEKVLNQASVQVGNDPAIKTEIVENPVTKSEKNATAVEPGAGNHVEGQPAANDNGTPEDPTDDNYNDVVVQVGDTITYTIDWENYNETTANVTITDKLDPGLDYVEDSASDGGKYDKATRTITWTLKDVAAGKKGSVTFKATVNENARSADKVTNSAKVKAGDNPEFSTKPVENPVPEKKELTPGANRGVNPGDEITYEISWMNTHDEPANVVITDVLDPGVTFKEFLGETGDAVTDLTKELSKVDGRTVLTWTFKAAANTSGTVSFKVTVNENATGYDPYDNTGDLNKDGKVVNQAQVQVGNSSAYTNKVENPTTNPHKTENTPGDGIGVQVGDEIMYTVTFENYKNKAADVIVTDKLDPGLDYLGDVQTLPAGVEGVYDKAANTVTWTFKNVPARGEENSSGFVTFKAKVNEKAADYDPAKTPAEGELFSDGDGKVVNQASVKIGNDPAIDTEIRENPVSEPDKNATAVTPAEGSGDVDVVPDADDTYNDAVVQVGDTIEYTISWENYEKSKATVTIEDTLEAGLTYVSASDSGVYDAATRTITWKLENVPARDEDGSRGTVTFRATVNENARPAGKVTNDASVQVGSYPALSTKPVENPVPEKTEVTPGANFGVKPGDVITYEITWENTYDVPTTVTITDELDPGVEYVQAIGEHAADASYDAHTVTWTFTAAPNTKDKVSFQVRVLESAVDYAKGGDGKVVNRAKVQVGDNSRYTNEVENPTTGPHKTENAPGDKNGVQVGDKITYTVTFENYKNEPATVVITDKLDPGLDYVRGTAISTPVNADGDCVEGVYDEGTHTLTWTITDMPKRGDAYSTGTVTFETMVNRRAVEDADDVADGIFGPGDSKVLNQADVKVGTDPEVKTEIVENPVSEPEKDVTAVTPAESGVDVVPDADGTYNDTVVQVGDTITYTIKWKNYETDDDGNPVEATVKIKDKLEDGLDYVKDSASDGGDYNKETRTIKWELTAGPGAEGSVTFQATVNENARPESKVTNSARVKVGNHPALTTDPVENPIPEKTETDPGDGVGVYPDSEITYEVSWENTYDEPADVTVTDELDPGVEYVENTAEFSYGLAVETAAGVQPDKYTTGVRGTGVYNAGTRTITWTIPDVPANTKGKVTFKVRVLESAVDYAEGGDGKVVNRAKVKVGNNSRYTNEVENPTTRPHKMENTPGDGHGVRVGDEIMYTILYENYRSKAADVIITDELDPGLDYVEGSAQATAAGAKVSYENHTLTWTIPDVPARGEDNSTGFVSFRATVNQRAVDDSEDEENGIFGPNDKKVLNQAEVQVGRDPKVKTEIVENPVTDPKKHVTAVEPQQGNHEVALQPNEDGTFDDVVVQVGDVITYTINWENYESTTAVVTITDKLEEGLTYVPNSATSAGDYDEGTRIITWTLPNIPARGLEGSTGTVSFKATVNKNAGEADKVDNYASVKVGNHPAISTNPVENPVPEKTEVTPGENLGVYPGDVITYEISWANTHDEPAEVVITDVLDPGVKYVEAIGDHAADAKLMTAASLNSSVGAADQNNGQTVIWTFTADPNTSGKVSFRVEVLESALGYEQGSEDLDKDGKVVNQAQVQVGNSSAYTNKVENPTTNPHKEETAPGDEQGVKVGDQIDYKITYENYKNAEATVTITDRLDPGLDYVAGSASNGGVYNAATRTITWTLEKVPARGAEGCTGLVTFSATVNEKALDYGQTGDVDGIFEPGDGKVLNQASVQVDTDPAVDTEIVENPVTEPEKAATAVTPAEDSGDDIAVEPNADGTYNDVVVQVGDVITYTIKWENYEETEATVIITDQLEDGLTYVPGSAEENGGVYDAATRTITWTLTNVPARGQEGSTGYATFQATVNENAEPAGKVTNDASVKVGNHGELKTEPVENPIPEKTEVTPGENLGVRPDDVITYEVSWENTYDEPADVIVTDELDPGVEYVENTAEFSYGLAAETAEGVQPDKYTTGIKGDGVYNAKEHIITWTIPGVPANTKGTVTFQVKVLESAVDYAKGGDGKVMNRAKVQVGNNSRYTNVVENPTTEPQKSEVTPGDKAGVRVGDTIEYEVTYENYRNEPATVTITDELDPGLTYVEGSASNDGVYDAAARTITWKLENVPARGEAGSTGSVTFKATVNELASDEGAVGEADGIFVPGDEEVLNQAEVQVGNDPKIKTEIVENPVTEPEKEATAVTPAEGNNTDSQPDADGTYNDVVVQVDDVITYTIRWENYEETEADVTITDELEAGLTYVEGSAGDNSEYDAETRTITWTLTKVPAGSAGIVTFQATVNENARPAGKVTNDASVKVGDHPALSTKPVENPVPEKTEVTPGADLGVHPGDEITYEVSWENTYDEESTVTITDKLDPGVEFVQAIDSTEEGLEAEHAADASYDADTHTVTWTFTADANTKGKVAFIVKVLESAVDYGTEGGDGKVVNRAKVQVGNSSTYTNEIENPTTEPHKSEVTPGDKNGVRVGDTIEYQVTYENYRNEPATVTITDELDPGLDYVDGSASDGGVYDAAARTITWTLKNVPARGETGSTGHVTFQATVNEKALDYGSKETDGNLDDIFVPGDGKVVNQAAVKVDNDPAIKTEIVENPVTEPEKEATEITPKEGNHEVELQPNADGTYDNVPVQVGDTIIYTIKWENYEETTAAVIITDTLEAGLTYVPNSATSGGNYDEATRTITWTLLNIPARGLEGSTGTVSFKATVDENAGEAGGVKNNANVAVGNHPAVSTEPVENPVPEKTEVTPGENFGVYPGDVITYEISWMNTYDEPAEVVITDALDPGVKFVEAVGEHSDAETVTVVPDTNEDGKTPQTVTWKFTAEANTSGKVSFRVEVLESAVGYEPGSEDLDKDGKVVNQAQVQVGNSSAYTNKVENPTTNPHKTETAPGDKEGVKVGDRIDYMVTYENYKNAEATVTITDRLDPGLDYVDGSASDEGVYDAATRTITWKLEKVSARGTEGCTGFVTFSATVNEGALDYGQTGDADGIFVPGDGKVVNQAQVQVDTDPAVDTETVENPVTEPEKEATEITPAEGSGDDIAVEPNADGTFNDTVAQVGDVITYTIKWENYEETEATVIITDQLEDGLTYVEGSAEENGGVYDAATRTITWTLTNVPARGEAGSTGEVSFQATVNENAAPDGKTVNNASVKVGNHGAVTTKPVENPVPEKTEVAPGADLGVAPGDEITYEIGWENAYDEAAKVVITDPLDAGVSYAGAIGGHAADAEYDEDAHTVTWTFQAEANAKGTVSLKVVVLESAVDYGTEGGDGKVVNRAKVQVGNSSRYTNEVENPTTEPHKTEVTPGDKAGVQVGDTIEYEVTYENYRNEPADVTITDELDPGLDYVDGSASDSGVYDAAARTITWKLENVPARGEDGSTGSVTFKATVNQKALDADDQKVLNQAEVQVGNDPKIKTEIVENPVTEPKKEATEITPAEGSGSDIAVGPNADGTYNDVVVQVGDTITYTIEWKNYETDDEGNPVNADVTITDELEAGLTYVDGSASDGGIYDEDSRTITWTLKNVAPGEGTVTFQVTVNENAGPAGKVTNDASVKVGDHPELSTKPVENPIPEKTEVTPGEGEGVYPDDEITYEVSWENTCDEAAAVVITDSLDAGVSFVEAFGNHADDAHYDAGTHTVTWTFTADANTKGKVAFIVKVLESAVDYGTEGGDGKVVNRAKVQVGNSSRWTNEIENPTTEPHKTEVTPGDKAGVQVGDTIEYQVTYENYRNEPATVTITDKLDPGLDYVDGSASDGGVYDAAARTITWTLENVPARGEEGSAGSVTFKASVNQKAVDDSEDAADGIFVPGDKKVLNQAVVQVGDDPKMKTEIVENPVTEPEKHAAEVEPKAENHELELTPNEDGTYDNVPVQVGDTITYTIKWENYESETADVMITDTLEAGLDYVPNSATSAGEYDEETRTITWSFEAPAKGLRGSSGTVSFKAVVNKNAAGMVTNSADVKVGNHPALSTKPVENPVPEKAEVTPGENLGVYPGDEITYEVSWANTYDEDARVVITDALDPGVRFLEAAGEHAADAFYNEETHTVTWTFTAEAGTSGAVSFKVEVLESAVQYDPEGTGPENDGKVVNQAQVQVGNNSAYTNEIENPTTNPHKTEETPGNKAGVQVGDQIDYVVTYENYKDEAATVTVTDRLDPGLDYVEGSASSGGVYDAATRTITWTFENMPARGTEGCTGFVTFSAVVNEKALDYGETGETDGIFEPGDGKVLNQAVVKVGDDPEILTEVMENPVSEPEKDATAVTPAESSGDVAVEPNEDGTFNDVVVQVGDTITYTIQWENYENAAAVVMITDTLDPGLDYVDGSADNGGVYDAAERTITWTFENVPARGTEGYAGTVTFQAVVNENARPAGKVRNNAAVKVGNQDALTTKTVENPLPEKTERTPGEDLMVYPGMEITYDITWENTYEEAAPTVITDELDPGVEFVEAVDGHAADAVYDRGTHTVTWTFTADGNTKGTVSFTVRVLESAVDYADGGDGKVVNRAKVQVGNNSRYTNEVENPTTEPHKSEVTPGDGMKVQIGDTIEYRIDYENYKDEAATVIITDRLDPGLDYVAESASNGGVYNAASRTITWTLENVPARGTEGSAGFVTFSAEVNEQAADFGAAGEADGIFKPGDAKVLNQAAVRVGDDSEILTEIVENPLGEIQEVPVGGIKLVNGEIPTADQIASLNEKVEFQLWQVNGEGTDENLGSAQLGADGTFRFADADGNALLVFTQADVGNTYTYRIVEARKAGVTDADMDGYTIDGTVHTFTVEVQNSDENDGVLNLTVTVDGVVQAQPQVSVTFNNLYEAENSAHIETTKTLTGRALSAGEFTFDLRESDEEWTTSGPVLQTVVNGAGEGEEANVGRVIFADLVYMLDDVGTHYYVITERTDSAAPGITYDTEPVRVKVVVSDNGDGTLETVVTYEGGHTAFTNVYEADGRFKMNGLKLLEGNRAEGVRAGEFSFLIEEVTTAADGTQSRTNVGTGTTLAGGTIDFTEFVYGLDDIGTHTYVVTEVIPAEGEEGYDPAITYSTQSFTVTVTVVDAGDGTLSVAPVYPEGGVVFVNYYTASDGVPVDGVKLVNGAIPAAEQITGLNGRVNFQLWQVNGDGTETDLGSVELSGDGTFSFGNLSYTQEDIGNTYTYRIVENQLVSDDEMGGFTVDGTVHIFTVEVRDSGSGDGTLNLTVTVDGVVQAQPAVSVTFNNLYEAENSAHIETTKTLTGRALSAGEFTFDLRESDEEWTTSGPVLQTVVNGAGEGEEANVGRVIFADLVYTLDDVGTHYYVITERTDSAAPGITYDMEPVRVRVVVSDNGDGTLETVVTYEGGHTAFTNVYEADGRFKMNGLKLLEGNRAEGVRAGEFSFLIEEVTTAADGTQSRTSVGTGTTLAGGTIDFTEFVYGLDDIGTHTYVVTEVIPAEGEEGYDPTITYSTQSFTVTVTVTDSGTGTLAVAPVYPEGGVVFVNRYEAESSAVITAVKTLVGAELAEGQFTFELRDAEGTVLQTAVNGADGSVSFEPLAYTQDDIGKTYTYTVSEQAGSLEGVTYDGTVYTAEVTVEDNGDGTLGTEVKIFRDGREASEAQFTNVFEGSVTLHKTDIDGQVLPGAVFELYVQGADGTYALYTGANATGIFTTDSDGIIHVEGLSAGNYYFLETQAPDGYRISEGADGTPVTYPFVIAAGTETGDAQVYTELNAVNERLPEEAQLVVTKRLTFGNEEVTVENQTFYVALYSDPEYTQRVTDIMPVVFENASSSSVTFTGLEYGMTYYVAETDAEGNVLNETGGVTADGQMFSAYFGQGNTAEFTEGDGTKTIIFENVFTDLTSEYYLDAELTVTKKLLGTDGLPKNSNEVFYAGIFSDEEHTTLSDEVSENIVPLDLGGGYETSVTIDVTVMNGEKTKLYVTEVTKDGTPVKGSKDFGYTVTVDGAEVSFDVDNTEKTVTITNRELPEEAYYFDGELTITKELFGPDGTPRTSEETFYAGIFADAEHTKLSDQVSENIVPLSLRGDSTVGSSVQVAVVNGQTTKLYVTEVTADGVPVGNSRSFAYDVTVEGAELTFDTENQTGAVTIRNQERQEEETETEQSPQIQTEGPDENNSRGGGNNPGNGGDNYVPQSSVKTGDETPIALYLGIFLAAAAVLVVLFFGRRRRVRK